MEQSIQRLAVFGSLNSEKRLNIQGVTNITPAIFVAKCHTVNSSQKSRLRLLDMRTLAVIARGS